MITKSSYEDMKVYYEELNKDKSHFVTSNDIVTPLECVEIMIDKIPEDFWKNNVKILDPCCGNGNFFVSIYYKLLKYNTNINILENMLYFNDINDKRLTNVKNVFHTEKISKLNISQEDFLLYNEDIKYDLIITNPPYAKLMKDGKRTSKNHNLIKDFISKSLKLLKENGYLLFITPDNWMSYADRNKLIEVITSLQIVHLDIHTSKKYFKGVGSSFTWYLIENTPYYKNINISGIWNGNTYSGSVPSITRRFIPLLYTEVVHSILLKTLLNDTLHKFKILTSSDLHRYTKKNLINITKTSEYTYKLIHTPKQTVYSSRPHKYQDGYKVFISTTDKYSVFVDNCGMTQSIAFILCSSEKEALKYKNILLHPLYVFLNNICRWGNFNNIRILQSFPIPDLECTYESFSITKMEIDFIKDSLGRNYHLNKDNIHN